MAARSQRQSVTALLSSGVVILVQFALFLFVGAMLFVFYRVPSANFGKADRIFPTYIVNQMPHGISGLLIAAILAAAMSNLSAALNSLSSTSIIDFYLRNKPQTEERRRLRLSRVATFFWAVVLFGLALLALAPLLGGCGHDDVSADPQHDVRTEARREQDCANPSWKAANLGLWYNLCQTGDQTGVP